MIQALALTPRLLSGHTLGTSERGFYDSHQTLLTIYDP